MFKILKALIFSISVLSIMLSVANFCYAGWPINVCPGMEGRVLDATTGQPIENAIIRIRYIKNQFAGADSVDKEIGVKYAVTDKMGKYVISSKISWHVISTFYTALIQVRHPFYDTKMTSIRYTKDEVKTRENGTQYGVPGKCQYIGPIKNGKVQYDFKLISMEDKWKSEGKKYYGIGANWDLKYFESAKELHLVLELEKIFSDWDIRLERYNNIKEFEQDYKQTKNYLEKYKKEISLILGY